MPATVALCALALMAVYAGPYFRDPVFLPRAAASDSGCWTYKSAERSFARKINEARTRRDRVRLDLDPELSKVARVHTREMVEKNLLYHTPSRKLTRRVTRWSILGENVGVGGSVSSLHKAFMNSPAHRDNILRKSFRYVGVGTGKSDGRLWVTVIFEAYKNPGTTLKMAC